MNRMTKACQKGIQYLAWAVRHPLYAASWIFRGQPYSADSNGNYRFKS